jgi:hypothetical protein
MKRFLAGLVVIVISSCSPERPFENPAVFGLQPLESSPTKVSDILGNAEKFEGKEVLVEGITGPVCQNRGCWMYVAEGGSKIRVNFKDYAFFVPKDSEGKRVRAYGVITSKLVSKETLQHWAEEEEGGDPTSIHGDSTVVMLTASGVLIENGGDLSEDQKEMMSEEE